MRPQFSPASWLAFALTGFCCASAGGESSSARLEFNRDIRPILSDHCFRCHGPDKSQRKARLRLDVREVALEREAFVPGKPAESELVRRINATGTDDLMPPEDMHKPLSAAQKDSLKRWIAEGAAYQPHWAYIVPKRPAVPKVGSQKSEVGNAIDAFVRHELELRKINPSPEADRRTLLRRLSLDLIGLPPTPDEIASFLKDKSPDAYGKQVERLLASPHYGERMAVPWLDLARYADTVGYHGDQNQNIFPYRDYVINAFNANKPFDQFTIEQLAGDLLPNPTVEQKTATAFNRLNMMTREGGAQPKEYLAKYQADRVRTVSTTWLGSTMGCCECHDHKYDPLSAKDFYSLAAYFADVTQWGVYSDYAYTPNSDLKGWSNEHPFPPEMEVDSPYLQRRLGKFQGRIAENYQTAAAKLKSDARQRIAFEEWRQDSLGFLKQFPTGWASPQPKVALKLKDAKSSAATNFTVQADATVSLPNAARETTTLTVPLSNMWLAAIRLEVVPQPGAVEKAGKDKRRNGAAFALNATLRSAGTNAEKKLAFSFGDANHKEERYSDGAAQIGVMEAWSISRDHDLQQAVWLLKEPLRVFEGQQLSVNLGNAVVSTVRISISPFAAEDPLKAGGGEALQKALAKSAAGRSRAQRELVNETYLLSAAWDTNTFAKAQALFAQVRECRNGRAMTLVTQAREPITTRVLPRGNWQDESGEIVQPHPPQFISQSLTSTDRLSRLDLARWLVSPDNPLTARTFVNRLWKQYFGTGLSGVVDDLGAQGEWPTHPELLDWLAVEFRESGWDVKHLVKLIVTSATYRQTAGPRPDLKDIDPNNRLLACQSPRRLEAEFVRDNALAIAGLLNAEIGGPSVRPYQPPGYYANLQFPDRDYYADKDDRQYRRGVYAWWQRTFLQPMLANFDAPAREECSAIRNNSNTPQQALTLLNDPTFVETARVFAEIILAAKAATDEHRFDDAFRRALARVPKPAERESLAKFLAEQRSYYGANPEDAKKLLRVGLASEPVGVNESELAAWTQVCRVVLNLHETITRY